MTWLKTAWKAISAALLAALVVFAAASARGHKKKAEKWQAHAVNSEGEQVKKGVLTAKQAQTKAKLHKAKADEIKKKAEDRITAIGAKDEDVADILARWGT